MSFNKLLIFIYGITKFSGLLFISIDFKSMKIIKHHWNNVYFFTSFGLSIVAFSYDSYFDIQKVTHSKLMEIGINLIVRVSVYSTCFLKAANAIQNRKFYEVVKNLSWCHAKVNDSRVELILTDLYLFFQLNRDKVDPMSRSHLIGTSSIFFGYILIFFALNSAISVIFIRLELVSSFRDKIFFGSTILLYICLMTSLMMCVSCGYQLLKANNIHLLRYFNSRREIDIVDVIRKTSIMYDRICDIFDGISSFFSLIIIIFLLGFTYCYVFFAYGVYILVNNPNSSILLFLSATLLWIIYYSPCVIYLTLYSSWIRAEACQTADLIQLLVNREKDLQSLHKASIFALFVCHRTPKISCGLFEINWKTFFGLMGSIFSFSIILIQFYDVSKE